MPANYVLMETLDAKALRMFTAVVRAGSIRSAAEHLHVAASVVSRQIADTEKNVGLPLFERSSRGVGLTDAGRLVLEHAQRVIEDREFLSEQLNQLRVVQQIRIRICCGEGFLADMIEHGLRDFVKIYPTVSYSLTLGSTDGVLDGVANGDTDIGIAYNPVIDTRVRSMAISRQPLCLVAPIGHSLLQRTSVTLQDCLAEGHYALLSKGHGITQLVGRVAADSGVAVAPLVETPSIDVLRRFVMADLGVTFLPHFAISTELSRSALGAVELSDLLLAQASAHLLVKARRRLPASVERLASHFSSEMAAFKV
jgi:DNA-binding transcriptional LysR family regulator